jgi:hypothetical protein
MIKLLHSSMVGPFFAGRNTFGTLNKKYFKDDNLTSNFITDILDI